jgi:hypothetical protein
MNVSVYQRLGVFNDAFKLHIITNEDENGESKQQRHLLMSTRSV